MKFTDVLGIEHVVPNPQVIEAFNGKVQIIGYKSFGRAAFALINRFGVDGFLAPMDNVTINEKEKICFISAGGGIYAVTPRFSLQSQCRFLNACALGLARYRDGDKWCSFKEEFSLKGLDLTYDGSLVLDYIRIGKLCIIMTIANVNVFWEQKEYDYKRLV